MFCPECKCEYRPGFTHCSDCDVDLVPELPELRRGNSGDPKNVWVGIERVPKNSVSKSAFTLALHQFIGIYGIPNTAPLLVSLAGNILFFFGHRYPQRSIYLILSEKPYFPVQITFALILGWLLGRSLHHRSMVWVWVLPLAILGYSVASATVLIPTSVLARPGVGQSRISHYFGWGCRPADNCLDQLLITMPFYSSLAYSLGAVVARKALGYASQGSNKHFWAVTSAGVIVFAASVIDLVISIQRSGWHNTYLLLAATPTGLGLGVLLLHAGSTIRRQHAVSPE